MLHSLTKEKLTIWDMQEKLILIKVSIISQLYAIWSGVYWMTLYTDCPVIVPFSVNRWQSVILWVYVLGTT